MNITCKGCGAEYKLSYTRTIMRDKDRIHCECGHVIHSWNESKIWDAEPIRKQDSPLDGNG